MRLFERIFRGLLALFFYVSPAVTATGSRKQYIASYYLGLFDSQGLPRSNEVCVFQVVPTNNLFRCCAVALCNGGHIVATLHLVIRNFACDAAYRSFDFLIWSDEVRILNSLQVLNRY